MKKISFLLLVLVSFLSLVSCAKLEGRTPTEEPQTEPAVVESIKLKGDFKTEYVLAEELDLTSMSLEVKYSDGSTKNIAVTSAMLSSVDMNSVGPKEVTVTYEGITTKFNIVVNPKITDVVLESIEVKGNYKAEYEYGQPLDLTGMKLILHYSDNSSNEIAVTLDMLSAVDMNESGRHTITVTYKDKTTTFNIRVAEEQIVKVDPVVEFSIEGGTQLVMGVDSAPTFTVTPDLTYTYHYESNGDVMGHDFAALTNAGYYSLVVNVEGDKYYNDLDVWVVFELVGNKLDPEIIFSIESGDHLFIGRDSEPTVIVNPSDLEYEIFYTKDEGATVLGQEFPTEPGIYAINVKVKGNSEYNSLQVFRWFELEKSTATMIDAVFSKVDGGYIFSGFVDSDDNQVELDSSLYEVYYEKDEQFYSNELPTEVGEYVIVVTLSDNANYEFITLSHPVVYKKVWRFFEVVDTTNVAITKVDAVFSEVDGGYIFLGFVDEDGNSVDVDSSLYTVCYEKDEQFYSNELPTLAGSYSIVVTFNETSNYEFITLSHPAVNKKVWQGFLIAEIVEE